MSLHIHNKRFIVFDLCVKACKWIKIKAISMELVWKSFEHLWNEVLSGRVKWQDANLQVGQSILRSKVKWDEE